MSDSDQNWNPDDAWAPPATDEPSASQPAPPQPQFPAAPPAPPAPAWWSQPGPPSTTPPPPPAPVTPPAPPAAPPSWTQSPTQPTPAATWPPQAPPTAPPSWSPPAATSWPPQPPPAVSPPVPPSGGGWGYATSAQPDGFGAPIAPTPPWSTGKRVVAAIAALALVLVSAGVGASIAIAMHGDSSAQTAFPTVPSSPNGGSSSNPGGSNGFGSGGSGSGSSANGAINASTCATKVTPSIVNINTTLTQGRAAGTGIVISSSGLVLTNNHVIADATSIKVDIGGTGNTHSAKVIGYDVEDDVALAQIDGVSNLKTATFGDTSKVRVGDPVVAIGNTLGKGGTPAVSQGKVTALNQQVTAGDPNGSRTETLKGMIQIDAPIQPGDSGGALIDADCNVIGINTAAAGGRFTQQTGSDVGFAIPIDNAVSIAHKIQNGDETDGVHIGPRALLGVSVRAAGDSSNGNAAPVDTGALVVGVQDNSAASDAGIAEGDVITSVAGKSINDDDALHLALTIYHPGDKVDVSWVDASGTDHSQTVELGEGPPA